MVAPLPEGGWGVMNAGGKRLHRENVVRGETRNNPQNLWPRHNECNIVNQGSKALNSPNGQTVTAIRDIRTTPEILSDTASAVGLGLRRNGMAPSHTDERDDTEERTDHSQNPVMGHCNGTCKRRHECAGPDHGDACMRAEPGMRAGHIAEVRRMLGHTAVLNAQTIVPYQELNNMKDGSGITHATQQSCVP